MSPGFRQKQEKPGGTGVLTCAISRVPQTALMVDGAHPSEILPSRILGIAIILFIGAQPL
jgi:hypothetical protein